LSKPEGRILRATVFLPSAEGETRKELAMFGSDRG
jgi:hypothetical protein